jgi:hypothetical protein
LPGQSSTGGSPRPPIQMGRVGEVGSGRLLRGARCGPSRREVVAIGEAGAGVGQGGGQGELVGVCAAVESVGGVGVLRAIDREDVQVAAIPLGTGLG